MATRTRWTDDHRQYVIDNYFKLPVADIAKHLGRTEYSIRIFASHNNLTADKRGRPSGKPWTDEEIEIVKNVQLSIKEVAKEISRTYSAVKAKRLSLGIVTEKKDVDYWKQGEVDILKNNPELTNKEIAEILRRTEQSVQLKRARLGLKGPSELWSADEIKYLKKYYFKQSKKEIADALNRSATAVMSKAYELGITKKTDYWSKVEIQILTENIQLPNIEISRLINKTADQIAYKKAYLNSRKGNRNRNVTFEELEDNVPLEYKSKSNRYADLLEAMNVNQSFEFPTSEIQHIQAAKNLFPDKIFKIKPIDETTSRLWRLY
jgi:hypothetical protein